MLAVKAVPPWSASEMTYIVSSAGVKLYSLTPPWSSRYILPFPMISGVVEPQPRLEPHKFMYKEYNAWFPALHICSSVAVSSLSVAKVRKNYVHP